MSRSAGIQKRGQDLASECKLEVMVVGVGASRSADELEATGLQMVSAGVVMAAGAGEAAARAREVGAAGAEGAAGVGATNLEATCKFKPSNLLENLNPGEISSEVGETLEVFKYWNYNVVQILLYNALQFSQILPNQQ